MNKANCQLLLRICRNLETLLDAQHSGLEAGGGGKLWRAPKWASKYALTS